LDALVKRADISNEIRQQNLDAQVRLVEYTMKAIITPHKLAFETLLREYKNKIGELDKEQFEALPMFLEQPM
jgi:NAD(P)H-hydrate repair Nnr-like enzyme with NAD(P)H-hydrate dehydratase domain